LQLDAEETFYTNSQRETELETATQELNKTIRNHPGRKKCIDIDTDLCTSSNFKLLFTKPELVGIKIGNSEEKGRK
jgi:hypothetical protein